MDRRGVAKLGSEPGHRVVIFAAIPSWRRAGWAGGTGVSTDGCLGEEVMRSESSSSFPTDRLYPHFHLQGGQLTSQGRD